MPDASARRKRQGSGSSGSTNLRHTFGTHAIPTDDSREVMERIGHQDLKTTQIYLSFKPQRDAAGRTSGAFQGSAGAGRALVP